MSAAAVEEMRLGAAIARADVAAVQALLAEWPRNGMLLAPLAPRGPDDPADRTVACHALAWAVACLQAQPLDADTRAREAIVTLLDRGLPVSYRFAYRGMADVMCPLELALELTNVAPAALVTASDARDGHPPLPLAQRGAVALRTWACFSLERSPYMRPRFRNRLVSLAIQLACLDVARWALCTAGWRGDARLLWDALHGFGASGRAADNAFAVGAVRELLRLTANAAYCAPQDLHRARDPPLGEETWASRLCQVHAPLGWACLQETLEVLSACRPDYVSAERTRALAERACAFQADALAARRHAVDAPVLAARLRAQWRLCLWLHGEARADWAARMLALARLSRRVPLFQNSALVEQELLGGAHAAAPPPPPPEALADAVQLALAPQIQPMPIVDPPRVAWPRPA